MILTDANLWVSLHDTADALHPESLLFFQRIMQDSTPLQAPALLLVEVSCALSRKSRNEQVGRAFAAKMRTLPQLSLIPLDAPFIAEAIECGTKLFLRAADAFYAAAAERTGSQLVTWDAELIQRANGITPTDWLAANP